MIIKKSAINSTVLIAGIIFVATATVWYGFIHADTARAWRSLLTNYLFFTSVAAGMVVWPAIVIISNGKWMGSLEKLCWTGLSFAIPSLVALVILWSGSSEWAPWLKSAKPWLNNNFLFTRNLVLQVIFWLLAFFFMTRRSRQNNKTMAGILILVYAITFSVAGFDFVMALEPSWHSMMMGGYFFISALYIASAAWALLSSLLMDPGEKSALHDIGKLVLTFCMLTSYLMFSQLLPIWYENLPDETIFLIPRMNFSWKYISMLLLALVYLGPILMLLNRRVKESPLYMASVSAIILAGMWIECWWLVSAVFEKTTILFGWVEVVPTIAFLALLTAGISLMLKILPEFDLLKHPEA